MFGQLNKRWIAEDDAVLIEMAAQGWTLDQIARRLRRTSDSVEDRAKKLGVMFGGMSRASSPALATRPRSLGS